MKKHHLMLVTFSAQTEDGSRKTLDKAEICSTTSRGTAELIKKLLQQYSAYRETARNDHKANETIRKLVIE
ncbi:MAG: hypothetical protein IIW86_05745 [Clostridia bacterium]|nr:hypothetical protein [Clostridia bacterium]